jgi:hypothetical protein
MASLINARTQSGKTHKTLGLLQHKIDGALGNTLVLFITQANCTASATQTISRVKDAMPGVHHVYKSSAIPDTIEDDKAYILVDYWNAKCTKRMLEYIDWTVAHWHQIIVVLDEADQGGRDGLVGRLTFVSNIERIALCPIHLIFVTATAANLSKSIATIAIKNPLLNHGIVNKIIHESVVEHHHVDTIDSYVGPSWFNEELEWIPLKFKKAKDEKQTAILNALKDLPDHAKRLSLIVTSTRTIDHEIMARDTLGGCGFNVSCTLNAAQDGGFVVKFGGNRSIWQIPTDTIYSMADRGDLAQYSINRRIFDSGIKTSKDITLAHILQACLFMTGDPDEEERIKVAIDEREFAKLVAIANAVSSSGIAKNKRRPADYPLNPRVALIAGHIAGRGITIQNPAIAFTCTSFCLTDTIDTVQRGASNSQRFGRACGMLKGVYQSQKPILIATPKIMKDALANETVALEKASEIQDGTLVCLKSFISKDDWDRINAGAKQKMKENQAKPDKISENTLKLADIKRIILQLLSEHKNGLKLCDFKEMDPVLFDALTRRNRRPLTLLLQEGLVVRDGDTWRGVANALAHIE